MNNRVVANGTPLDDRFDNVARAARRAGYAPGAVRLHRPGRRPRASPTARTTRGCRRGRACCPASTAVLDLTDDHRPWLDVAAPSSATPIPSTPTDGGAGAAASREHAPGGALACRRSSPTRCSSGSTARTSRGSPTPRTCARTRRTTPPGAFATMYDPADVRAPVADPGRAATRCTTCCSASPTSPRPADPAAMAAPAGAVLRDDQRGRRPARPGVGPPARAGAVGRHVHRRTADHGEQLGDHGLDAEARRSSSRATTSSASSATRAAPARPRHRRRALHRERRRLADDLRGDGRRGARCSATACRSRRSCDGEEPPRWRDAAHYEWDWRDAFIATAAAPVAVGPAPRAPAPRRAADGRAVPTCSSATARGGASTSPPTRRGGPRSTTPPSCSPTPRRCSSGARATPSARSPTCCSRDGGIGRFAPYPGDGLTA